jgi:hypothetical protein
MKEPLVDDIIKTKIAALDNTYPAELPDPDLLWEMLLERRSQRHKRKRILWRVAASLLILVVPAVVLTISFHKTNSAATERFSNLTTSTPGKEALEYISRFCAGNNISCASPAVRELQQDLKESSTKLSEINRQIQLYGSDARLIRAKTRIENHQTRVIKAIVQTL